MHRPSVKICGLTRHEDALLADQLGADYLGMITYAPSPRSVSRTAAWELCQRLPAGKRVFVDVNTPVHELEGWADMGFDYFQIHCAYELDLAALAGWSGVVGKERLWLAPKWPPQEPFPQAAFEFCDTVLVDTYQKDTQAHGGSGRTGNWPRFAEAKTLYAHKRLVLAGGLAPDNISLALEATAAEHIDVSSGVEASAGIKDPARLKQLFEALPMC